MQCQIISSLAKLIFVKNLSVWKIPLVQSIYPLIVPELPSILHKRGSIESYSTNFDMPGDSLKGHLILAGKTLLHSLESAFSYLLYGPLINHYQAVTRAIATCVSELEQDLQILRKPSSSKVELILVSSRLKHTICLLIQLLQPPEKINQLLGSIVTDSV